MSSSFFYQYDLFCMRTYEVIISSVIVILYLVQLSIIIFQGVIMLDNLHQGGGGGGGGLEPQPPHHIRFPTSCIRPEAHVQHTPPLFVSGSVLNPPPPPPFQNPVSAPMHNVVLTSSIKIVSFINHSITRLVQI